GKLYIAKIGSLKRHDFNRLLILKLFIALAQIIARKIHTPVNKALCNAIIIFNKTEIVTSRA
ncbi:MAG: hypothetical protein JAY64_09535, partial [Candidatus Thiodiazotropha weberae]|nr:hypothetical protein [Candidatus Thiodiazotropha lotti]MCW4211396.1 hypothetical protein [Candidatus Thiodiazotropha lotti]